MRIALGLSYSGTTYQGWQTQPHGCTIQDKLEAALLKLAGESIRTTCAGRTDTGVHALMQVVHFDTVVHREESSWIRGTNTYLPCDIAVQWARVVPDDFHARARALSRCYRYVLLHSAVRPSLESGRCGWVFQPLDLESMQIAVDSILGTHDFSSFRAAMCQAFSPIKTLMRLDIRKRGAYFEFDFEANAFLHHMVRNLMGCLIAVGQGKYPPSWLQEVLAARSRELAAPTFAADGLYFVSPRYDEHWQLPNRVPGMDGWFGPVN